LEGEEEGRDAGTWREVREGDGILREKKHQNGRPQQGRWVLGLQQGTFIGWQEL